MQTTTRTYGVTLYKLDLAPLVADAQKYLDDKGDNSTARIAFDWALGTAADGTVYAICDEGVGEEVKDGKVSFEVWADNKDGKTFSIFPALKSTISLDELEAMKTGETVDLADFVRVFGSRLEDNFRLWFHTLHAA